MCDCYRHKCKECETMLPIHLGDFNTGRDEIEVFCNEHIPEHDVTVFKFKKSVVGKHFFPNGVQQEMDEIQFAGTKIGIRSLTENARANSGMNYPNLTLDCTEEIK